MTIFLALDGVNGESTDDRHKGEIELLSWALGVSNAGSTHVGGGAGAGKASFTDLSITKVTDLATPALLTAVATGRHLRSGTLTLRSPGQLRREALRIALFDVQVTGCSIGASGLEVSSVETVTLTFGRIQLSYTAELPDGSDGPIGTFGWDLTKNGPV